MGEVGDNGGAAENGEKPIMVAVDESECSHHALMWVLENLKESISATSPLLIFMAQPPPANNITFAASLGAAPMYCPPGMTMLHLELFQDWTTIIFQGDSIQVIAASVTDNNEVTAKTVTEIGDAKAVICAAVLKHNVKLLVLGERGIGKIQRAILGSVSNYCVQNSKCPVLVVKKAQVV